MGSCRNCGGRTKYNHNNGWCSKCFFLNPKQPRFWSSVVLTLIILYLPLIDGDGLRSLVMEAFFKETKFFLFLIAKFAIDILGLVGTFLGVSKFLYSSFKMP